MARLLVVLLPALALAGAAIAGAWLAGWRPRLPALAQLGPGEDDPRRSRNHFAMARWIDTVLGDEMVRPLLSPDQQARGRQLLAEFYGEEA